MSKQKPGNQHGKKLFNNRGQGLIETALFFPVLIIVLTGLIEMGFMINAYMALQDAARNAARFAVDSQYTSDDYQGGAVVPDYDCDTTQNFYRQTACLVNMELEQERPRIELNLGNEGDDVLVSVFSVVAGETTPSMVDKRFPLGFGEAGWSEALDTPGWQKRNQSSHLTSAEVNKRLFEDAPSTGYVLVEVFYEYAHQLKLPWITPFIPDPVSLYAYAFMPLSSAEPTPTPIP